MYIVLLGSTRQSTSPLLQRWPFSEDNQIQQQCRSCGKHVDSALTIFEADAACSDGDVSIRTRTGPVVSRVL
ncbi:hypothetical protein MHYP_G00101280 [Metynnis hypsauchen]